MMMPGLETLALSEIRAKQPDAEQVKFAGGIFVAQERFSLNGPY
jgi:hypothetical protein